MNIFSTLYDDKFDFAKAREEDIYFAFIIKLPFRFRVKNHYHCHFKNRDSHYDIWIENKPLYEADPEKQLVSLLAQFRNNVDELWSTVAIIPNKGTITSNDLSTVQNCEGNVDRIALQDSSVQQWFRTIEALNAFIAGYQMATGESWGGRPLRPLRLDEFMESVTRQFALIGIHLNFWTEETITKLFDGNAASFHQVGPTLGLPLFDLPPDQLSGIEQAIERLNSFYFYELAFEAKVKKRSDDNIGAMLMAVAALEGVHGALVGRALEAKLPGGRTGDDKNLEENYLKELGFSLSNKVTPYLLMDASERPKWELIKRASIAVKYRNEVMHALRNSSGAYRIRTRTDAELDNAYSAVMELYDVYRIAFERMILPETIVPIIATP